MREKEPFGEKGCQSMRLMSTYYNVILVIFVGLYPI